ncbi:unnamed protein product [Sphenostylis stenocarpa]|uniref:Uncharacterized protein n=1 Tax=Sphenostylis stenocarpa TaxID=92480 RepID=A0AA86VX80_9FABA|nr:unnamed protein product [Sphenostylis stenocarpa]
MVFNRLHSLISTDKHLYYAYGSPDDIETWKTFRIQYSLPLVPTRDASKTEMGLELLAFFLHFNKRLLLEGLLPMSNALFYSMKTKSWCYNQIKVSKSPSSEGKRRTRTADYRSCPLANSNSDLKADGSQIWSGPKAWNCFFLIARVLHRLDLEKEIDLELAN